MTNYYVSNSGSNKNTGDEANPLRTIQKGISKLNPGDTLFLRGGVYVESVTINKRTGPILIRSYPGEHACIDGSLENFLTVNSNKWEPASLTDPHAHPQEYISTDLFVNKPNNPVNKGAFLDNLPYTRLVTYSSLDDFRSENETFDRLPDYPEADPRPGPQVLEKSGGQYVPSVMEVKCVATDADAACKAKKDGTRVKSVPFRYPWSYMGPGLWFDRDQHRVHIRLSHTHNQISGLDDYLGETDPNLVPLAISSKLMKTLTIANSEDIRLEDLSIRYGGESTITILSSSNIVFDHVRIFAAPFGVVMGGNPAKPATGIVFQHCEFDGGLPAWYFRNDRKVEYFFSQGDAVIRNTRGKGTLDSLLIGNPNDTGTRIHHCEFHDGHDLYLYGADLQFHHNWIHNLNDEGLFLDAGTPQQMQSYGMDVYQNVITKTQSAISFAGNHVNGHWNVFRNLVDLRTPTAGFRPKFDGDTEVWRFGQLFKLSRNDGDRDVFQNTFLVYNQRGHASYLHYQDTKPTGDHTRRTFNNIFVAVNPNADSDKAITFIPSPSFHGPTDGNDYYRIGQTSNPPYRYLAYTFDGDPPCLHPNPDGTCKAGTFASLAALHSSTLFKQSKTQYAPGYEASSREEDPVFCQFDPNATPQPTDDLRLSASSTLLGQGVILPAELQIKDPLAPLAGPPDMGCYPFDSGPLQVGVDGRKSYPSP